MEKINFVCNPRIILYDIASDPTNYTFVDFESFIKSDLWNKQLSFQITSSVLYPATVFEVKMFKYRTMYSITIHYWDGVGVYEVELTYDNDDRLLESNREYCTI